MCYNGKNVFIISVLQFVLYIQRKKTRDSSNAEITVIWPKNDVTAAFLKAFSSKKKFF